MNLTRGVDTGALGGDWTARTPATTFTSDTLEEAFVRTDTLGDKAYPAILTHPDRDVEQITIAPITGETLMKWWQYPWKAKDGRQA